MQLVNKTCLENVKSRFFLKQFFSKIYNIKEQSEYISKNKKMVHDLFFTFVFPSLQVFLFTVSNIYFFKTVHKGLTQVLSIPAS